MASSSNAMAISSISSGRPTPTAGTTNTGQLENRLRFGWRVIDAIRERIGPDFIMGVRHGLRRAARRRITPRGRPGDRPAIVVVRVDRLHQRHPRPHRHGRRALPRHSRNGLSQLPHLDFAGEVRTASRSTTMHASRIQDVATARHAIAAGETGSWSASRGPTLPIRTSQRTSPAGGSPRSGPAWAWAIAST